jgi:hypothetical protein
LPLNEAQRAADMGNYDALVKLINGEAQSLFF